MTESSTESPKLRVLVVDDEAGLVRALSLNLRARGWDVVVAMDGAGALRAAAEEHPDVVLLDLGLPGLGGLEVIEGIRGWSAMPIVVLSARQTSEDKVKALDAGADDYVTKPFGMDELLARLRVAVRHTVLRPDDDAIVVAGELNIDVARHRVIRGRDEIRLTPTEWAFLEVLVRNRGKLVGRQQILREVWGPAYGSETNYLRVYVAQLRRKLETDPSRPRHIITQPGVGYVFEGVETSG